MIYLKFIPNLLRIGFILTFFNFVSFGATMNYVQINVKNGQSLSYLFKKYSINYNSCNIGHFKEINNVKTIEKLLIGKNYNLPILKLNYNGKSVQTSVTGLSKNDALKVINYNKLLLTKKIRTQSYIKNKSIWIPYDELDCGKLIAKKNALITKKTSPTKSLNSLTTASKTTTELKPVNSTPVTNANKKIEVADLIAEEVAASETSNAEINTTAAILRIKKVPAFGPDYEDIRVVSDRLIHKVFYLVSGHGGPDPGTMYRGENMTLCEDEYAYDVTLRLARKLMEQGAQVHLIVQDPNDGIRNETILSIDKDEKCITGYPLVLNQRLRLAQTTDATNDLYRKYLKKGIDDKDQMAIHIHIDSQDEDMRKDVYFYYQENSRQSANIARRIQRTLDKKYGEISGREYTGTISTRNLFVMRNTLPATVFMELGNIQNQKDHNRIIYPNNRQALAEWLYDGIVGED